MRFILLNLVLFYRLLSGSLHFMTACVGLPCQCRYPISCSHYALLQLKHEPSLLRAVNRIALRLLSCQPWFSVNFSPLPKGSSISSNVR